MLKKLFRLGIGLLCLIGAGLSLLLVCVVPLRGVPSPPHSADGVVIGHHRELTGRSMDSLRYYPIVRYRDASGTPQIFQSFSPSIKPMPATGTVVSVLYTPNDNPKLRSEVVAEPESAIAAFVFQPWVLLTLAGLLLVPFALAAYAFLNGRPIRDVIRSLCRRDGLLDQTCRDARR